MPDRPTPLAPRSEKLPDYDPAGHGWPACTHLYKKYKIGGAVVRLCALCGAAEPRR